MICEKCDDKIATAAAWPRYDFLQDFPRISLALKRYLSYLGIIFLESLQEDFVFGISEIPKILRYCALWCLRLPRPLRGLAMTLINSICHCERPVRRSPDVVHRDEGGSEAIFKE
jgi:hypothetical protein